MLYISRTGHARPYKTLTGAYYKFNTILFFRIIREYNIHLEDDNGKMIRKCYKVSTSVDWALWIKKLFSKTFK